MEELLNNVFAQVFILTASIGWSFWYLKREQRKEDASDVNKRIADYKASASHTADLLVKQAKHTAEAVNDLNTATIEVLKERKQAPVLDVELQKTLLVNNLVKSLNHHPDEWVCDRYTIKHKKSKTQIWYCNGEEQLYVRNPVNIEFNKTQKRAIFQAVQEVILQRTLSATEDTYRLERATAKNKKHKAVGKKYRAVPVKKKNEAFRNDDKPEQRDLVIDFPRVSLDYLRILDSFYSND